MVRRSCTILNIVTLKRAAFTVNPLHAHASIGSLSNSEGVSLQQAEEVQLQPRAPKAGGFSQTLPTSSPTDPIKVTLHDCLACSGCVTTAETILLEHQSVDELLSKLADPAVHVVMSISPQSRASLGLYHGLSTTQVGHGSSVHLCVPFVLKSDQKREGRIGRSEDKGRGEEGRRDTGVWKRTGKLGGYCRRK